MSENPDWNIAETNSLITQLYGKDQMRTASQSIWSALQRRDFARYHYREGKKRWSVHREDISKQHPIDVIFRHSADEVEAIREERVAEIAAHVHACVHSLHTIADTMAHALYYGLALNISSPLSEAAINANAVEQKLFNDPALAKARFHLVAITSHDDFAYIHALNNHGKHRSLITPGTWFELRGKGGAPITLEFSEFTYKQQPYDRREIWGILESEYERVSKHIVLGGIEMHEVLRKR